MGFSKKLVYEVGKDEVIEFHGWYICYPKGDYQHLSNDTRLVIEFKGKRIVEFELVFERIRITSEHCILSMGDQNIEVLSDLDKRRVFR